MSPNQNPYNGRTGEMVRWIANLAIAALVAWLSASGAMQSQLAVLQERESNHYLELIKRLDRIETGLYGVGVGSVPR